MSPLHDTLTLVIRLACELEHTHAPETLEVLDRWRPALDAMLAGKSRDEAVALMARGDAWLTDRLYHYGHINRLARAVGALGEDTETVVNKTLEYLSGASIDLKFARPAGPEGDGYKESISQNLKLRKALEQCVRVTRQWHAMPQEPNANDAFDIYFNHSPEMKLIRDALGKMPDESCATDRDGGSNG